MSIIIVDARRECLLGLGGRSRREHSAPRDRSARTLHVLPFVPFPKTLQPPGERRSASLASKF